MNAFGIDYQHTLSLICLREGRGDLARLRPISDGQRLVIPHAAQTGGWWGSAALQAPAPAAHAESALVPGPWLTEPGAGLYWKGVADRLYRYLGRMRPVLENGYRVVVSVPIVEPSTLAAVEQLVNAAGLTEATCIDAPDALCCRWLSAHGERGEDRMTVTVVVVGDTATLIRAYRVEPSASQRARVIRARGVAYVVPIGVLHWVNGLLDQVKALLPEQPADDYRLVLRDAAIDFGMRVAHLSGRQSIRWDGPLHDRLYQPFEVTREACNSWATVNTLNGALPESIRLATREIGSTGRPDYIVLGGIGTMWPFPAEVAATVGPVWQGQSPAGDVATGAAWWPEWARVFEQTDGGVKALTAAQSIDLLSWSGDGLATTTAEETDDQIDPAVLPPWDR